MGDRARIVLVSMPWESVSRPSLAVGLLVAIARDIGFDCTALHLNLELSAQMGVTAYDAFAENLELFPLGEHFFAVDIFGPGALDSGTYLARFGGTEPIGTASPDPLHVLRDRTVPDFLDDALGQLVAAKPDIVGFSCTFNQVLPSLALARRLKAALPGVTILLGGACVHGRMGVTYAQVFSDIVDHVFTGEADESFPAWLEAFVDHEPHRSIPGVTSNREFVPGQPPVNLERLPTPIYDDYFAQRSNLESEGIPFRYVRHLPYESSRGCWWGENHHCTFCGLNNEGMLFRRKSAGRVVRELEELAGKHGFTSFMASDNILDFKAYSGMLGDFAAIPLDLDLFYEIKANVGRVEVAALRNAGVRRVQPGIESFSDHVLQIMRKGITGLQNVQVLKWLQEYDVAIDYNILIGFPGETLQDYLDIQHVIRAIGHLPPPNGTTIPIRIDRFSPFFNDPERFGISGLRAADYYRHLIPKEVAPAEGFAYFFDHDEEGLEAFAEPIAEINRLMEHWKGRKVERRARLGKGSVELLRATEDGRDRMILRELDALVFVLTDRVTSLSALQDRLAHIASHDEVVQSISNLAAADALVAANGRVVATVAYAEAHSDLDLRNWAESNGLPSRSSTQGQICPRPVEPPGRENVATL
jgi:ribosomal peptide maturation radical SAM protein 1